VLLERTDLAPKVMPTQMNAETVRTLKRCRQAQDRDSTGGVGSRVPNAILKASNSF
jgi:hypothetical protein